MSYARFRPIKKARKHKQKPRYFALQRLTEETWRIRKPEIHLSSLQAKAVFVLLIALATILPASYAYYSLVVVPSLPNPNQQYDPFTTLWNGTNPAVAQGPIAFKSAVNATGAKGVNVAINLPALTVTTTDTIVVTNTCHDITGTDCSSVVVSDTQSNSFTKRVSALSQPSGLAGTSFNTYLFTAQASATGSDTISLKSSTNQINYAEVAGLDYSGVSGFGITFSNFGNETHVQSGTVSITTTSSSINSFLVQSFSHTSSSATTTVIPTSSQTVRDRETLGSATVDLTGVSGSTSLAYSWNNPSTNCDGVNGCGFTNVVLEMLTGPTNGCPSGYQCLNSKGSPNGDLRLFANTASQTLDSFHPSVTTFNNLANDRTVSAGQTFTVGGTTGSFEIGSSTFLLNKTGIFTGTLQSQIYAVSGTAGVNAIPTGPAIASSATVSASVISSGLASALTFSFGAGPILNPGTYFVTVNASSVSNGQTVFPIIWLNGVDTNHNGAFTSPAASSTWTSTVNSYWFTVTSSNSPSEMITTTPINTATSASKELLFFEDWHNVTNLASGKGWGWYLTLNSTLSNIPNYNPLNDTSVAVAVVNYGSNTGQGNAYAYVQKQPGISVLGATSLGENPFPTCPQTSTIFICASPNVLYSPNFVDLSLVLNFTGRGDNSTNASGFSLLCSQAQPLNLNFCATTGGLNNPCSPPGANICATRTLPWLNIQSGNYYLGFWSTAGQTGNLDFGATQNSGATFAEKANSVYYWVPNPTSATTATTNGESFFGWIASGLGTVWNLAAGALSPLTAPILNFGGSILGVVISALIQWLNLMIQGALVTVNFVLSVLRVVLNGIGAFAGWGPIGDQFFSFMSGVITYFTTGLGDALNWLLRLILRSIDLIKIANNWVNFYLTGLLNFLADGLNTIAEVVVFATKITTFLGSSYVLIIILFYLWYVADLGIAGVHGWFETVKWLAFISFDFLERMINFGISSITWLFGRIPTLDGTTLPELPTIAIGGGPIWPSTEMTALREGNVFSMFFFMVGIVFMLWFETTSLPGSIAANVPAAAPQLTASNPFINIFLILIAVLGLVFVINIPAQLARKTFDLDSVKTSLRSGVISTGGGVSGRFVKRHPERKARLVVNRGLGVSGLRPHLRKAQIPSSKPTSQGVG